MAKDLMKRVAGTLLGCLEFVAAHFGADSVQQATSQNFSEMPP
jgi:hypothetical protein